MLTAVTSVGLPELLRAPEGLAKHQEGRGECLLALGSGNSLVGFMWCEWQWLEVSVLCKCCMGS